MQPYFGDRCVKIFATVRVDDPLQADTLVGPLIDKAAFDTIRTALVQARSEGGTVSGGQRERENLRADAWSVCPVRVCMPAQTAVVGRQTFAPILCRLP